MRKLIRANGTTMDLPAGLSMRHIAGLIGAEMLDTVSLHHMGRPLHVLVCDDHGWETETIDHGSHIELRPTRALNPLNVEATRLYLANSVPDTEHQIVGDCVVVPDDDFS